MSRRYSYEEKRQALKCLEESGGDFRYAGQQTGIPVVTLRRWARRQREERGQRLRAEIERLHEQLVHNAVQLADLLERSIEDAPLNQVATALGGVIDRYLKIDEYLASTRPQEEREQVIRIEYLYPDGSIHNSPPWAAEDCDDESPVSRGGVWSPFWEDPGGQDNHRGNGYAGRDVLVVGSDVPDGKPGVARPEDDAAGYARAGD
jgi:transposase-like protein